jgi:hypothetical protein
MWQLGLFEQRRTVLCADAMHGQMLADTKAASDSSASPDS